jgi:hypothetical protein
LIFRVLKILDINFGQGWMGYDQDESDGDAGGEPGQSDRNDNTGQYRLKIKNKNSQSRPDDASNDGTGNDVQNELENGPSNRNIQRIVKDYQHQDSQDQSKKDYIQKRIKIDVLDQNPYHSHQNTDNQQTQVMVVKDFASSMDTEDNPGPNSPDRLGARLEGPIMIQENNPEFALLKNNSRKSGNTMNLGDDKGNTAESMNFDIAERLKANGLKNREFSLKKNKPNSKKKKNSKANSKKQSVNQQQHQEFNIKIQDGEFQKNLAIGPEPQTDFGSTLKEANNFNGGHRGRAKRGPRSTDLAATKSRNRKGLKKITGGNCSSKENQFYEGSDGGTTGVIEFSCT